MLLLSGYDLMAGWNVQPVPRMPSTAPVQEHHCREHVLYERRDRGPSQQQVRYGDEDWWSWLWMCAHGVVWTRYYCIVLQYNAKLNAEQLMRFVRELIPEADRPGRKHFNFQHAPADVRVLFWVLSIRHSWTDLDRGHRSRRSSRASSTTASLLLL